MSYLLVFCTISLIITLHELGHLLAAKRMGIPIARFSIGFGRRLWGFRIGFNGWRLGFVVGTYALCHSAGYITRSPWSIELKFDGLGGAR